MAVISANYHNYCRLHQAINRLGRGGNENPVCFVVWYSFPWAVVVFISSSSNNNYRNGLCCLVCHVQ